MISYAFCKINLTLEILGTDRPDGFHDLKTIMHKIPLGDKITLVVQEGEGNISLACDAGVCQPEENLAYKAAKAYLDLYREKFGKGFDVWIELVKITPTGAGLGGGSADAACVLDMLHQEIGGLSEKDISALAQSLGSDVPFCLKRYISAYCTGRGEICRSISTLSPIDMIVAKPKEGINTKGIYGEYDKSFGNDYSKSLSDTMEKALESRDLKAVAGAITNDFEKVCIPRLPEIANIKNQLLSFGALCSQMSGSGSAVFGIFDSADKAKQCFKALKDSDLTEVFLLTRSDFEKMYKSE